MVEVMTRDEFIDQTILSLQEQEAPNAVIALVDRVLRPFLELMDEQHELGENAVDFIDGVEAMVGMMIVNFVGRVATSNTIDEFADASQEIINNISLRLSEGIAERFEPKGRNHNVVQLPKKG